MDESSAEEEEEEEEDGDEGGDMVTVELPDNDSDSDSEEVVSDTASSGEKRETAHCMMILLFVNCIYSTTYIDKQIILNYVLL